MAREKLGLFTLLTAWSCLTGVSNLSMSGQQLPKRRKF